MNISKQTLNFNDIEENLDAIKKKLYLESPDLWIDFCDKVDEKILDEMVLFYASKYNYSNVIKFAIDNNITDINKPSKNRTYTSIKEHLISVARDCNSKDVFNFLNNNEQIKNKDTNKIESIKKEKAKSSYFPVFNCSHCNTNILKTGYKIYEEISFAFCEKTNKPEEINKVRNDKVFCCNCNKPIENITTNELESFCSITHCKNCKKDLIQIGINEKIKMNFNSESKQFNKKEKTYNCYNCDKELDKYQIEYFKL